MARENNCVVMPNGDEFVVTTRQQAECCHWLALRTGRNNTHAFWRIVVDVFNVDVRLVWQFDNAQVARHSNVVDHGATKRGDYSPTFNCRISNLLHAVNVAGKACGNDASCLVFSKQLSKHNTDGLFRRR